MNDPRTESDHFIGIATVGWRSLSMPQTALVGGACYGRCSSHGGKGDVILMTGVSGLEALVMKTFPHTTGTGTLLRWAKCVFTYHSLSLTLDAWYDVLTYMG